MNRWGLHPHTSPDRRFRTLAEQFDPPPRVVREIKIGGDNGPRPERDAADFLLKHQVVELFEHLDRLASSPE